MGKSRKATAENLIVPGAQKSGTTSLYHYLANHPEIHPSSSKEPEYFSHKNRMESSRFERLFPDSNGGETVKFEASTSYLYHPEVPERINETLGGSVRFIVILRNPVERAVSAYWHLNKKFEDQRHLESVFSVPTDKERALKTEEERIEEAERKGKIDPSRFHEKYENPYWPFRYLRNSFYSDHLERYTRLFPENRMKFVLLEELVDKPDTILQEIKDFLDLESDFTLAAPDQHNRTKVPKRNVFYSVLHHYLRPAVKTLIGKPDWLTRLYGNLTFREKPDYPRSVQQSLGKLFSEEESALAESYGLSTEEYWQLQ